MHNENKKKAKVLDIMDVPEFVYLLILKGVY